MAKQSMIQRELKRERLISKYSAKRQLLKEELKTVVLSAVILSPAEYKPRAG